MGDKRWSAMITYNSDDAQIIENFQMEELEELDEIVESGPDWNTIDHIVIHLTDRSGAMTLEAYQKSLSKPVLKVVK